MKKFAVLEGTKSKVERDSRTTLHGCRVTRTRSSMTALVLSMFALVGCAGRNPILSSGPSPRVEDCVQIQQATPTKYVCGGKLYTSVQLAAIRNGQQVQ